MSIRSIMWTYSGHFARIIKCVRIFEHIFGHLGTGISIGRDAQAPACTSSVSRSGGVSAGQQFSRSGGERTASPPVAYSHGHTTAHSAFQRYSLFATSIAAPGAYILTHTYWPHTYWPGMAGSGRRLSFPLGVRGAHRKHTGRIFMGTHSGTQHFQR